MSDTPSRTHEPYREAKTFRDAHGQHWFAHEVTGESLGGGPSCLLLVSAREVRRIFAFPPHWRSLSANDLLALKALLL
ncbi:MAG: hypothetical protein ACJ796_01945 [Gemmatimonadaceae bacterium]